MKSTIAILSLIVSANVFALNVTYAINNVLVGTTLVPVLSSATSSGVYKKEQDTMLLNDAQEMLQNGNISIFLSQKIQEVQDLNVGLSEVEALDILIESAQVSLSH